MTVPATTPTVEDLPLEQLREWPRNPRRISKPRLEQLKRALEAEPEMLRARPLIALPDGTVVAGNQRLRAARELGWPSLPVVVVDLDEDRAKEWALRDNRPYGEDDEPLVGELLAELAAAGRGLDLTGYESGEVDRLLAAVRPAPVVDPDEAPPLPAEPRSVRGEVYELGPHRLMCGDATSAEDLGTLLGDARPDLLFTDPPYGVNYQGDEDPESLRRRHCRGDGKATVGQDALGEDGTQALVAEALRSAAARLVRGGAFYVCSPSGSSELIFRLALVDAGLELRQAIVWAKDVFAFGRQDYHWRHETILYGWTSGASHRWLGGRDQDTVWEIPRPKRSELHPTMKPVALMERALLNHSALGDLVLDPFGGSGSTLIAAEGLKRRAALLELDPAYCDVIRQRYADFTGQPEFAP